MKEQELTLREQQLIILDILKYFDAICRKYDIKYALFAGTLIGAIRHKGFIPWDDDIDVYMVREEYEKFRKVWKQEKNEYYEWIDMEDIKAYTSLVLSKILYKKTFVRNGEEKKLFLDIFILDYVGDTEKDKKTLERYHWYVKRFHMFRNKGIKAHKLIYKLYHKIRTKIYFEKARRILNYYKKNTNKEDNLLSIGWYEWAGRKDVMPSHYFDKYIEVEFEGGKYYTFSEYDKQLRFYYGDYMQLPPEEKRVPHH